MIAQFSVEKEGANLSKLRIVAKQTCDTLA